MARHDSAASTRHHALAIPFPAQGHMNPLMRLCKTLARHHGFTVTFVNLAPLQQRIEERIRESGGATSSSLSPEDQNIRVVSVPMPATPAGVSSGFRVSIAGLMRSAEAALDATLQDLVHSLSTQGPPVTCLISDVFVSASTQKVADTLRLPRIVFFPSCQALLLLLTYISTGIFPLDEATQGALQRYQQPHQPISKQLHGLPGLVYRDLLAFKHVEDETHEISQIASEQIGIALANTHGLNTFVVNSFPELEMPAFQAYVRLSQQLANSSLPRVYPIGPLLEDLSSGEATNTSLLQEDHHCLSWLDSKPPRSVLYISFGSIALLSKAQFQEFLFGLEASSQSFLLVFRPELVGDASYTSLPQDFLDRTKGLGYVVRWALQLRVLSHPAIGGFLTHCGWNSTLEAIANGVPMLCWPYVGDQYLDAKYIVDEWKIGLRAEASRPGDPFVTRDDIELLIKSLMQSPKGEALREKAMRLSSLARECCVLGGSSYSTIQAIAKSLYNTMHTT